jgi:hypothetical protein
MGESLFPGAEDGKTMGIGKCQNIRRNGTGGGCTNCSDLASVNDAHRSAGLGFEQKHKSLVRLLALRSVAAKDRDELGAERLMRAECTGHNPEDSTVGERNVGAKELLRFTAGESDHRFAHDGDATVVGEAAGNFIAIDVADSVVWAGWHGGMLPQE